MTEVGPFSGDGEASRYTSCDFCYQTAVDDIWAGKPQESQWRRFYRLADGCVVCGPCVAATGKDDLRG